MSAVEALRNILQSCVSRLGRHWLPVKNFSACKYAALLDALHRGPAVANLSIT
jgi:hypothetical protein